MKSAWNRANALCSAHFSTLCSGQLLISTSHMWRCMTNWTIKCLISEEHKCVVTVVAINNSVPSTFATFLLVYKCCTTPFSSEMSLDCESFPVLITENNSSIGAASNALRQISKRINSDKIKTKHVTPVCVYFVTIVNRIQQTHQLQQTILPPLKFWKQGSPMS